MIEAPPTKVRLIRSYEQTQSNEHLSHGTSYCTAQTAATDMKCHVVLASEEPHRFQPYSRQFDYQSL